MHEYDRHGQGDDCPLDCAKFEPAADAKNGGERANAVKEVKEKVTARAGVGKLRPDPGF